VDIFNNIIFINKCFYIYISVLLDASGHYESDDETGFFFEQLKQIQLSLDEIFEEETQDDKKES